jgi:hypothetical protein
VKNIFVFGADDFNLAQMQSLRDARHYRFHKLFRYDEMKAAPEIPVKNLFEGALEQLKGFSAPIDAIVGYWDFPVSTMLPLLRRPYGLPSPSFEAVLKCEHKYWSRLEQQKVVPGYIPDFCAVNPFADDVRRQIPMAYPFWIKPVKAASSHLGFKVGNDKDFQRAITLIRRYIFRLADGFNYLLRFAERPDEIIPVDGYHCIAESMIARDHQCTLEGYVYENEVVVYGIVDSIREGRHHSCFSRYQYPAVISPHIQEKMFSVTRRVLHHIGFDNGPFNIEFFWQPEDDAIRLLEINTRISKSHCPLFRYVDGASHHQVMLDLGLGKRPVFPHHQGKYRYAAKFMWRVHSDAVVNRMPTEAELQIIRRRFPSLDVQFHVHEGMRLSELNQQADQDSYSYEIAVIFLGADSETELLQKYADVQQTLSLELDPVR